MRFLNRNCVTWTTTEGLGDASWDFEQELDIGKKKRHILFKETTPPSTPPQKKHPDITTEKAATDDSRTKILKKHLERHSKHFRVNLASRTFLHATARARAVAGELDVGRGAWTHSLPLGTQLMASQVKSANLELEGIACCCCSVVCTVTLPTPPRARTTDS
ncbi:hypothetical protein C0Q70_18884 [Pomacea canaliculata]|uniref:Uncharacterized protein n=1 Tax=Pomacea canaliculata TaxID=400727 RepID=A0A2T7NHS8_POMCA|nr:hypothetical protein C0Q70_18884 [Pomacea canaliculata]